MKIYVDFFSSLPTPKQKYHGGGNYARQILSVLIENYHKTAQIVLICPHDFVPEREIDKKISTASNVMLLRTSKFSDSINFDGNAVLFCPIVANVKYFRMINKIKARNPQLKIYATIHDVRVIEYYYDYAEKYYFKGILKNLFWVLQPIQEGVIPLLHKGYIKKCLGLLDKIFTVSNYSTQQIIKLNSHANVTYYYQSPMMIEGDSQMDIPKESYILFVSGGRRLKNLIHALGGFSAFKMNHKDNRDYLYITGISIQQFQNLCEYPKINKQIMHEWVRIYDYVSEQELAHLYKCCKFLLYTSKREGFGLPLLEAAMQHKTSVSSNVTSIPEVLGSSAYYVNPWDDDDIARGIAFFDEVKNLNEYENRIAEILPSLQMRIELDMKSLVHDLLSD